MGVDEAPGSNARQKKTFLHVQKPALLLFPPGRKLVLSHLYTYTNPLSVNADGVCINKISANEMVLCQEIREMAPCHHQWHGGTTECKWLNSYRVHFFHIAISSFTFHEMPIICVLKPFFFLFLCVCGHEATKL